MQIEPFSYNKHKVSIKDLDGITNISQGKWDFLFSYFLANTPFVYFSGRRLEYLDKGLIENVKSIVDEDYFIEEHNYLNLTFKVKDSFLSIGRGMLNNIWNHYEYPCLIFLQTTLNQNDFKKLSISKYNEDLFSFLERAFIVYKSFEEDVLWLEKAFDMEFPNTLKQTSP